jgi:hypothetical protein
MTQNNRVTAVKPVRDFILEITLKDGELFTLDFHRLPRGYPGSSSV